MGKNYAKQGDADAQYNLGNMYHKGEGVQQSFKNAKIAYKKAADQGHADAQYKLGALYQMGQGVEQFFRQLKNGLKKQPSKDMLGLTII